MKKPLAWYAVLAYAFLHVPLLILAIFSVNLRASRSGRAFRCIGTAPRSWIGI